MRLTALMFQVVVTIAALTGCSGVAPGEALRESDQATTASSFPLPAADYSCSAPSTTSSEHVITLGTPAIQSFLSSLATAGCVLGDELTIPGAPSVPGGQAAEPSEWINLYCPSSSLTYLATRGWGNVSVKVDLRASYTVFSSGAPANAFVLPSGAADPGSPPSGDVTITYNVTVPTCSSNAGAPGGGACGTTGCRIMAPSAGSGG
jgi:hypothetical protein